MSLAATTVLILAEAIRGPLTPAQMTDGYRQVIEFKSAHEANDIEKAAAMLLADPLYSSGPDRVQKEMERHEFLRWTRTCTFRRSYTAPASPKGGFMQVGEMIYLDCPRHETDLDGDGGERIEVSYALTSRGDGVTIW